MKKACIGSWCASDRVAMLDAWGRVVNSGRRTVYPRLARFVPGRVENALTSFRARKTLVRHTFRAYQRRMASMKKLIPILIIAAAASSCANASGDVRSENRAIVTVDGGNISGGLAAGADDVWSYRGIPFAAPPVGELRW